MNTKFLLKDIYVAQIFKVTGIEKYKNRSIFDNQGLASMDSVSFRLVYKHKDNIIDCITGIEYPLFSNLTIYNIHSNMSVCHESYILPFYEQYPETVKIILDKNKNPAKLKVDLKVIGMFQANLDKLYKALKDKEDINENKENKEYNENTF